MKFLHSYDSYYFHLCTHRCFSFQKQGCIWGRDKDPGKQIDCVAPVIICKRYEENKRCRQLY